MAGFLSRAGGPGDWVAVFEGAATASGGSGAREGSSSWVLPTEDGFLRPFGREVVSVLTTYGQVVTGPNDGYALNYLDGAHVLREVRRAWSPIPLHREEHSEWVATREEFSRQLSNLPSSVPANLPRNSGYPPIPEVKPVIMDLWPGEDGTVWVQRYAVAHKRNDLPAPDDGRPQLTWWQYPTFDVFGPAAEFLGTVVLPHNTRVALFHSDYLWTVRLDEHGEQTATRFRIVELAAR